MCATFNGGNGDVFPGDSYGVTTASGGESMRFGFDFGRNKLTVNARAETAPVKFRAAFASGRCVLAVNGFYEWTADKRKYYYRAQGGGLLLCGLWRAERDDDRRRASVQLDIFGLLGEEKTPSAPRDCGKRQRLGRARQNAAHNRRKTGGRVAVRREICARAFVGGNAYARTCRGGGALNSEETE